MTILHSQLAIMGTLAILIPILIHFLFRRRQQPIQWGAMRFLFAAYNKVHKRTRIEYIVLLLLRCAILLLVGLTLGRVMLQDNSISRFLNDFGILSTVSNSGAGSNLVVIIIDNSMCSEVKYKNTVTETTRAVDYSNYPTSFVRHMIQAKSILQTVAPESHVAIITTAQPSKLAYINNYAELSSAEKIFDRIHSTHAPPDIIGAIENLKQVIDGSIKENNTGSVYLLSDFLIGSVNTEHSLVSLKESQYYEQLTFYALNPQTTPVNNVQIASVEPTRHTSVYNSVLGSGQLQIQLRRFGNLQDKQHSTIRVQSSYTLLDNDITHTKIDERYIIENTVIWERGQTEIESILQINNQWIKHGIRDYTAWIESDTLDSDNYYYFDLNILEHINVKIIDQQETINDSRYIDTFSGGSWIERALMPDDTGLGDFIIEYGNPIGFDEVDLVDVDVLIVSRPDLLDNASWASIGKWVKRGHFLWLMPPGSKSTAQWTGDVNQALGLSWVWPLEGISVKHSLDFKETHDKIVNTEIDYNKASGNTLLTMISNDIDDLLKAVDLYYIYAPIDGVNTDSIILSTAVSNNDKITDTLNQMPLLIDTTHDSGSGYVVYLGIAADLNWSTLPTSPLMVALTQEIVRQGLCETHKSRIFHPGTNIVSSYPKESHSIDIDGIDFIQITYNNDANTFSTVTPPDTSGLYNVRDTNGILLESVAVNVYADSGNTNICSANILNSWLNSVAEWTWVDNFSNIDDLLLESNHSNVNSEISTILMYILGILIIIETFFARHFSHASISQVEGHIGELTSSSTRINRTQ